MPADLTVVWTLVIATGELVDDIVSPDVLTSRVGDSATAPNKVKGAAGTIERLRFRDDVVTGGSEEVRDDEDRRGR